MSQKTPLRDALKSHYRGTHLSPSQLDALTVMLESRQPPAAAPMSVSRNRPSAGRLLGYGRHHPFATASALGLLVAVFFYALLAGWGDVRQRVESEIAYNHLKEMSLEVHSDSIEEVAGYLSKLDFRLISSEALPSADWILLGGRYCSINSRLAAQLKVRNRANNGVYTLYQALTPDALELGNVPTTAFVDGVKVSLWQEQGLLLGLAGNP
jgi:hypothetical protein